MAGKKKNVSSGNETAGMRKTIDLDYRVIFNAASNGMAFTEWDSGIILDVNDAWIRSTGIDREKALGNTAFELGLWASQSEREACLVEIEMKGRLFEFEAVLRIKSVELSHMISAEIVKNDGKRFALWEFRDISGQKRIHDELIQTEEKVKILLTASEQSRRALLGILEDEKLAQEALRESEQSQSVILNTVPDGITFVDKQGRIVFANRAAEEILALDKSDITERTYDDPTWKIMSVDGSPFPPENLPFIQVKKNLKPVFGVEHAIVHEDGKMTILSINAAPILDEDGRFNGMVASITDITEHIVVEEALDKERRLMNGLIETIPDNIYFKDLEGRFTRVNRSFAKWVGLDDPQLIVGKTDYDFFEKTHAKQARKDEQHILSGNESVISKEEKEIWPDGRVTWVSTNKVPIKDEHGAVIGVMGISRNMTENKKAEEALANSESKFKSIYEGSTDAIVLLDQNGFFDCNPGALNMFGFKTKSEFVGLHLADVSPPKQPDGKKSLRSAKEQIRTALEAGHVRFEWMHRRANGEVFPVEILLSAFNLNGRKVLQATVRDITERKRIEESIRNNEIQMRAIIDNAPYGAHFYQLEPDNRLVFTGANRAANSILGVDHKQFIGKTIEEAFPPLSQTDIPDVYRQAADTGKAYDTEQVEYADGVIQGAYEVHAFQTTSKRMATFFCDITERKRAEQLLRESESTARTLINSTTDIAMLIDAKQGNIIDINEIGAFNIGKPVSDFIGKPALETIPDDTKKNRLRRIRNSMENGNSDRFEDERDGRFFDNRIHPIFDEDGKLSRLAVYATDITEHKQAEEKIREKDIQFRKLSSNVHDLIFQFTRRPDGTYCVPIASDGIKNIFGCSPEEVIEDFAPIARVIFPEDSARVIRDIEYSAKHLTYFTCEFRVQIPGKPIQWIYSKSTPEKLADGSITWYGFNADITERKQAEEALTTLSSRNEAILSAVPDIIMEVDNNKTYTWSNRAGIEFFGEDVIGHNADFYFEGEQNTYDIVKPLFNGQQDHIYVESWQRRKDGEKRLLAWSCRILKDENGNVTGALSSANDITELRKAEEAVKESNEMFSLFMRHSPIYTYIKEVSPTKGRVLQASENFSEMIGVPGHDMIGKTMAELFPPEFAEKITADDWAVVAKGEVLKLDEDLKDRHYTTIKFPIVQGDKTLLAGYTIDITERVQAETKLLESETALKGAQRVSHTGNWIWYIQANKLEWSDEMYRIFGYKKDTFSGKLDEVMANAIHPDDRQAVEASNLSVINQRKPIPLEYRVIRPDGSVRWVWAEAGELILDEAGKPSILSGIVQDITERKRAEEAQRESEERFRKLFAASPDALILFDPSSSDVIWKIVDCNDVACSMNGYTREELIGSSVDILNAEVLSPEEHHTHVDRVRSKEYYQFETLHRHKDGHIFPIEVSTAIITLKGRELVMGLDRDITDRKRAEEALKESELRYRLIAENISDVVFTTDNQHHLTFVSPSIHALTGYTPEEYVKLPLQKRLLLQSYQLLKKHIDTPPYELELERPLKKGGSVWTEVITTAFHDEKGRAIGTIGVMRDIGDRKEAELRKERHLHEQEVLAKTSAAFVGMESLDAVHEFIGPVIKAESGADYIMIFEYLKPTDTVEIQYASGLPGFPTFWKSLTGFPLKRFGFPLQNVNPELQRLLTNRNLNLVSGGLRSLLQDRFPKTVIDKIARKYKLESIHVMGFVFGEGVHGGVLLAHGRGGVLTNETFVESIINETAIVVQRRRAEEARRESEERVRSMILTANEGVWILDKNLSTVMVNQKMTEMLGYSIDEMLGMNPVDFMPHQDNRTYLSQIRERRKGKQGQYEQVFLRKDGAMIWLLISASPVLDDKGRFAGSFGMLTDITDRKKAEQEKERLIKELQGKNEELEAFTYTVSHDLKSPLVTVKGFLGMLQKDIASGDPNAVGTSIHYINDAVTKMEGLLRDLLDMSRVGRMVQPYKRIPYGQLTRKTAQLLSGMIRERGVKLIITRERTALYGDPVRMNQLMMNLLSNAAKFMGDQPKPVIEVGVRHEPEGSVFFVKDNGIGIEPKFHDKIFGLFDKLDPQTDGTGVGLAIVKRILQIHNGQIWVESEGEGKGSTFCFTLPKG